MSMLWYWVVPKLVCRLFSDLLAVRIYISLIAAMIVQSGMGEALLNCEVCWEILLSNNWRLWCTGKS